MPKDKEEWEDLGDRIRNERAYRGYSQQDVADYLEISRSSVSLMESGERKISTLELRKLAELFDTSIDQLVGESQTAVESSEDIQMVARAAKNLTPEDREEVLRFAEFLMNRNKGSEEDE